MNLGTAPITLALLDEKSGLTGVAVEGLMKRTAVHRERYLGRRGLHAFILSNRPMDAERIVIAQLKYSASNRDQPWTIARLTHSTNKKQDNSVIRK